MADTTPADAATAPPPPTDPYVIYQLRKPSQRGTAVIPRFVPNTHAPAFSPANYRFARVWATADHTQSPSSLLHVPRSFEYAASLGSESSFWSETSSWVSVSSLRTAQSDLRAPLLHSTPTPVSAASFFNSEFETPRLTTPQRPQRRTSQREFAFPPALSESISEDAVIDDLLSSRSAYSPGQSRSRPRLRPEERSNPSPQREPRHVPYTESRIPKSSWQLPTFLPSLTRKRRSLWQWLFCSENAAASTTVHSVSNTAHGGRGNVPGNKAGGKDRMPGGDREFLSRARNAPDAAKRNRRAPSFEIRRGKPEGGGRRSISWSLMPRAFLNKKESPPKKKKGRDRTRGVMEEEGRGLGAILQKPVNMMGGFLGRKESDMRREVKQDRHHERRRYDGKIREDRPRTDRPRERPHQGGVRGVKEGRRLHSAESGDQITSRITSDLTNITVEPTRSGSGHSTPTMSRHRYGETHDIEHGANGVLSDVSSHVSGGYGRASPMEHHSDHSRSASSPVIDFQALAKERGVREAPVKAELFAYPSPSSDGAGLDERLARNDYQSASPSPYTEMGKGRVDSDIDGKIASPEIGDPVMRAREKNHARSAGGPLSYLTKQHEIDPDVDTQSTGLTSLADESVSTHKTISATGDEVRHVPPATGAGLSRFPHRDVKNGMTPSHDSREPELQSDSSSGRRPIFKNAALFASAGLMSPSKANSGSPSHNHSDWSDPHATDIDVYCQCSCSCVYEEECRANCEAWYGRSSPSVSSTKSATRRAHSGFDVLPPAMDTGIKYQKVSSGVGASDQSQEPSAFQASRSPAAKAVFETKGSVEKRVMRASAMDELPDPRRVEVALDGVMPMRAAGTLDPRTVSAGMDGHSRVSRDMESRRVETESKEPYYSSRRRRDAVESYPGYRQNRTGTQTRDTYIPSGAKSGRFEKTRRPLSAEASKNYASGAGFEGNTARRTEASKLPPRRTSAHEASSRESSSMSRRNGQGGVKNDDVARGRSEHKYRDEKEIERQRIRRANDATHQMGNSYVVKRNGLPPLNQPDMPQPYRASGFGREVSYEYQHEGDHGIQDQSGLRHNDDFANMGYGPPPIVELEFETRGTSRPDGHRSRPLRKPEHGTQGRMQGTHTSKQDVQRKRPDSKQYERRKGESAQQASQHPNGTQGSSKQVRPTSRQSSKSSSRSRTPLFGIF